MNESSIKSIKHLPEFAFVKILNASDFKSKQDFEIYYLRQVKESLKYQRDHGRIILLVPRRLKNGMIPIPRYFINEKDYLRDRESVRNEILALYKRELEYEHKLYNDELEYLRGLKELTNFEQNDGCVLCSGQHRIFLNSKYRYYFRTIQQSMFEYSSGFIDNGGIFTQCVCYFDEKKARKKTEARYANIDNELVSKSELERADIHG
jgi:hypothetical protein